MRPALGLVVGACLSMILLGGHAIAQDNRITSSFKPLTFPIDAEVFKKNLSPSEREIYDLIEALLYVRLKTTLETDDATMVALATQCGQTKNQLTMLKWERSALREHLRWCLDVGLADAGLQQKLNTLLDYEEQIATQLAGMVRASERCIGVDGAAKLYLFVDDFERFLARRISEAVDKKHGPGPKHAASDEATPIDGDDEFERFQSLVRRENRDVPLSQFAGEDVIKLVDALLMVRLTQTLELSGDQSIKLFAHVGAHKDQLHELKWQIGGRRQALREALETGAPDDDIRKQVEDLLIQEQAVAGLMNELVTGAGKDISINQAARLYLFLGDFEQYIIGLLERSQI
jgi:hypothetical protein